MHFFEMEVEISHHYYLGVQCYLVNSPNPPVKSIDGLVHFIAVPRRKIAGNEVDWASVVRDTHPSHHVGVGSYE